MDPGLMDATLALLKPGELSAALRLLALLEEAGQESPEQAAEWRRRIEGWGRFHGMEEWLAPH